MNQLNRKWILAAVIALAGNSAMAQFAVQRVQGILYNEAVIVADNGEVISISLGDVLEDKARGTRIQVTEGTRLPENRELTVNGKTGRVKASKEVVIGIYWSGFSVAGPIQLPDSTFRGGTRTVYGTLISAEKPMAFYSGDRSLSVGGWWFKPDKGNPGTDLYQAHVRYHFNPALSAQVAYIDSTKVTARSASFHLIYRAGSQASEPNARTPWAIDIGLGVLTNFTNSTNTTTGVVTSRRSTNFSTFTTVSFQMNEKIGVTGTTWFVRDRNVDFLRFGVGLTLKF